jgi:hypothetical protein
LNPIPNCTNPVKYGICSDIKNLTELGTGVYLYFVFLKFLILVCILMFLNVGIVAILMAGYYNDNLKGFCENPDHSSLSPTAADVCDRFSNIGKDFLYNMNFENLRLYQEIINSNPVLVGLDHTFNINLLNFICMSVVYLINCLFILIISGLNFEAEYTVLTAEDYTLMIQDVDKQYFNIVDDDHILTDVLEMNNISPIAINQTFNIENFIKKKNDFIDCKKKLRYMNAKGLKELDQGCCTKPLPLDEVVKDIIIADSELNVWCDQLHDEKTRQTLINGTIFATFNDHMTCEIYQSFFPQTNLGLLFVKIKYYLCSCCYNQSSLKKLYKSLQFTVTNAPEPNDVKWENLNLTTRQRSTKILLVTFYCLIILAFSTVTLTIVSLIQKQTQDDYADNYILQQAFSMGFACSISLFNWIISKVMIKFSHYEKNVSNSEYQLSLSIKLMLFNFINTGPIPVVVNYYSGNWDQKSILIHNAFFTFIINSVCNPMFYASNPFYWLKKLARRNYETKMRTDDDFLKGMTQEELN